MVLSCLVISCHVPGVTGQQDLAPGWLSLMTAAAITCGWIGVKPAGCQAVWVVWVGLYGLCGSAGASRRDDVWRRALP